MENYLKEIEYIKAQKIYQEIKDWEEWEHELNKSRKETKITVIKDGIRSNIRRVIEKGVFS